MQNLLAVAVIIATIVGPVSHSAGKLRYEDLLARFGESMLVVEVDMIE